MDHEDQKPKPTGRPRIHPIGTKIKYPRKSKMKFNKENINEARASCGLPPLKDMTERACLMCGKGFLSEGVHNRMCLSCRKSEKEHHTDDHSCDGKTF